MAEEPAQFEDPFLDEVQAMRRQLSARFGHDFEKLFHHLEEIEARYADRISKRPAVPSIKIPHAA